MKTGFTKKFALLFLCFGLVNAYAQETVTYTLVPSELDPADDGYYEAGVEVDENDDGVMEFHNKCEDYYGDSHHNESGTVEGFTYGGAMIMPTCEGKGTPPEGWPTGYIQLTKHKYSGTDTASFGYIETPSITNLQSLEVKVGTDVSINNSRQIHMMIESSLDGGETWDEGFFINQQLTNQGGDVHLYMAGGESAEFNEIVASSLEGPIKLRILSWPAPGADQGQRLKIFGVELVASPGEVTAVGDELEIRPSFEVVNSAFVATKGNLSVYTITGILIGSGKSVQIQEIGLYVVKPDQGSAQKVFID